VVGRCNRNYRIKSTPGVARKKLWILIMRSDIIIVGVGLSGLFCAKLNQFLGPE
jgi:hypothetical protein